MTQGIIKANEELTKMLQHNDTLIQGLTEELTQTRYELTELQEVHNRALQETKRYADEIGKQQFYKQKLDEKMQMEELELRGLRTQLAKAERDLKARGVILAKPDSCATDVAESMDKIATTQGESSRAYQSQRKLLEKMIDLECNLNQEKLWKPKLGSD